MHASHSIRTDCFDIKYGTDFMLVFVLGIPIIQIIFGGQPEASVLSLPLLVYHPTQILLGALLVPVVQSWMHSASSNKLVYCNTSSLYFRLYTYFYLQVQHFNFPCWYDPVCLLFVFMFRLTQYVNSVWARHSSHYLIEIYHIKDVTRSPFNTRIFCVHVCMYGM